MAGAITEGVLQAGSLRDRLRAAKAQRTGVVEHQLPIPGYGGQLVARYRTLSGVSAGRSDWR